MASTEDIIGRNDINDLEAILSISNKDVTETIHTVTDNADSIFTWNYAKGERPALNKLYEKAKTSQWNGETDLPWHIDVDQEAVVVANQAANNRGANLDVTGTCFEKWSDKEWVQLGIEAQNWTLSQFMHGEQGALICTAKIVETVPWIDAKYYAATQVMDEARHVEVFAKYLQDKLSGFYPVNAHLEMLLDDIVSDSRWDMTYLGMQIMVEGLALAAFGFMHQMTTEPLLKHDPGQLLFQQMLFAKIVPNCKKLGLLDAGDGWLRTKFTELGVIDFEHMPDTEEEYEAFALAEGEVASA